MAIMVFMSALSWAALAAEPVPDRWSVVSPDGQLTATLLLTAVGEAGYPANRTRLYYRIEHGQGERAAEVLPLSPLGITRADQGIRGRPPVRRRGRCRRD